MSFKSAQLSQVSGNLKAPNMRKPSANKIVVIAMIILVLFLLTNLEIDSFKAKSIIYPISWIGIGWLGYRYFNFLRGTDSAIRKTILGLGFAFYVLASLSFGLGYFLCSEGDHGVSYTNKKDKTLSLVCRTFDCYGTADRCQLYKVRNLTKHIKWVTKYTKYNEKPIDTSEWRSE